MLAHAAQPCQAKKARKMTRLTDKVWHAVSALLEEKDTFVTEEVAKRLNIHASRVGPCLAQLARTGYIATAGAVMPTVRPCTKTARPVHLWKRGDGVPSANPAHHRRRTKADPENKCLACGGEMVRTPAGKKHCPACSTLRQRTTARKARIHVAGRAISEHRPVATTARAFHSVLEETVEEQLYLFYKHENLPPEATAMLVARVTELNQALHASLVRMRGAILAVARGSERDAQEHRRIKRMQSLRVLGLKSTATSKDVKRAYKKLALKHHPDRGGDREVFAEITEAFNALQQGDNNG